MKNEDHVSGKKGQLWSYSKCAWGALSLKQLVFWGCTFFEAGSLFLLMWKLKRVIHSFLVIKMENLLLYMIFMVPGEWELVDILTMPS